MLDDVKSLILELSDVEEIKRAVLDKLELGMEPTKIIEALNLTLNEVGEKYEKGDLFLSELMMIGFLASEITNLLKPHLVGSDLEAHGKVVIGTVRGDVHDIGKNIVIMMLQSAGYDVVDLGIDVSAERFVEAVKREKPVVLGMSALLTSTMNEMETVLDSLEKAGFRSSVLVIIGGRPVTDEFSNEIGADGYAEDAVKAVRVIKELMEKGE